MSYNSWLVSQPGPNRRGRIYCFSYAGGSPGTFRSWQSQVHPSIEICAVQLPGRAARIGEAPFTSMQALVQEVAVAMTQQPSLPFAFFGHSLGALLAFELTRYLQYRGLALPERLFVSACAAPQSRSPSKGRHKMPDDEFIDTLRNYNGTPLELLANAELMKLVLPAIRADFSLAEEYQYRQAPALTVPLSVLGGAMDGNVTMEQLEGWRKETNSACTVRLFDGDHFFLNPEQGNVIKFIEETLSWSTDPVFNARPASPVL